MQNRYIKYESNLRPEVITVIVDGLNSDDFVNRL